MLMSYSVNDVLLYKSHAGQRDQFMIDRTKSRASISLSLESETIKLH